MANPSDKQMLRDANGDLIPQYWDVVAGDFKPLTGSDGAQDTRLTGSIVEIIREHEYETTGTANAFFGETVSTGASVGDDLDVSEYKSISVVVINETDKEFSCESVYVRLKNGDRQTERVFAISVDVPSGSRTVINSFEHDVKKGISYLDDIWMPFLKFRILNSSGLGEGIIKVVFVGVKQ